MWCRRRRTLTIFFPVNLILLVNLIVLVKIILLVNFTVLVNLILLVNIFFLVNLILLRLARPVLGMLESRQRMALVIFSFSVVLLDWRWSTSSFSFDHQMGVAGAGGGGEPSKEDARHRQPHRPHQYFLPRQPHLFLLIIRWGWLVLVGVESPQRRMLAKDSLRTRSTRQP